MTDKAPTTEPRPDRTPEEAAFLRGWDAGYALAVKREAEAATPAETGLLDTAWKAAEAAAPRDALIRAGRTGMTATGWATAYLHGEHLETVFAATLAEALNELATRLLRTALSKEEK